MKKWVSSTDVKAVKEEIKDIEVVSVDQEQMPKPPIVVKKVINKKRGKK